MTGDRSHEVIVNLSDADLAALGVASAEEAGAACEQALRAGVDLLLWHAADLAGVADVGPVLLGVDDVAH